MNRTDHTPVPRNRISAAFTLVEVLTVIVIIGMLLGLLFPAVNAARLAAKRARIKTDMTQISQAIEEVRTRLGNGEYPPDGTDWNDLTRWCRRAFPRVRWWDQYNTNNTNPPSDSVPYPMITPDTAMIFWTCGIRDPSSGAFIGFSANPKDPFDSLALAASGSTSPSRIGPFFDVDKTRVRSAAVKKSGGASVDSWFYQTTSGTSAKVLKVTKDATLVQATNAGSNVSGYGYPLMKPGDLTSNPALQPSNFITVANVQYYPQNDQPVLDTGSAPYSPYLYFKAVANKYSTTVAAINNPADNKSEAYHTWTQPTDSAVIIPFKDGTTPLSVPGQTNVVPRAWVNPTGYQLLCPGLDGLYGAAASGVYLAGDEQGDNSTQYAPVYPDGKNYGKNTLDDLPSFAPGMVKADMP